MLYDCGRPGIGVLEIEAVLWVLNVRAIVPVEPVLSVTLELKEHRKRAGQDVKVHKEKEKRYMIEIL